MPTTFVWCGDAGEIVYDVTSLLGFDISDIIQRLRLVSLLSRVSEQQSGSSGMLTWGSSKVSFDDPEITISLGMFSAHVIFGICKNVMVAI